MKINKIIKIALGVSALTVSVATSTQVSAAAVTVVNAGFNDQTGWTLKNDALLAETGGPTGWSWLTPAAGNTVTSTEAIAPTEGTGFGITYAGADAFTQSQSVEILTAGDYIFSVDANALTGTVNLSNSPTIARPLLDGAFSLFAGSVFSPNMDVITTNDWMTFTWTTTLSAGLLDVGLRTTNLAIYSIAFDNFSITPVPVPAAIWLFGSGLVGLIGVARRKKA
jgi:hypothetical protein